jgi:hypothetical protein
MAIVHVNALADPEDAKFEVVDGNVVYSIGELVRITLTPVEAVEQAYELLGAALDILRRQEEREED